MRGEGGTARSKRRRVEGGRWEVRGEEWCLSAARGKRRSEAIAAQCNAVPRNAMQWGAVQRSEVRRRCGCGCWRGCKCGCKCGRRCSVGVGGGGGGEMNVSSASEKVGVEAGWQVGAGGRGGRAGRTRRRRGGRGWHPSKSLTWPEGLGILRRINSSDPVYLALRGTFGDRSEESSLAKSVFGPLSLSHHHPQKPLLPPLPHPPPHALPRAPASPPPLPLTALSASPCS
jgi:hypothetical protein